MINREMVEEIGIIGGLVGVQFVYAGNSVVLSYLMSLGLRPSSLIIMSTFATFVVLSPLAFYFERSKWPNKLKMKLMMQLVLISFGGVTLFQSLLLKGINLTSPATATAMPNLAPGLIFVISWGLGLEKVKISCMYSKCKVVGTLLCVIGAVTMSIMHSTINGPMAKEATSTSPSPPPHTEIFDEQKIIGCMYLMAAVLVLSSNVVLQATTLGDFPAPISLCAITSLIGVILTGILELIQHQRIETGWPLFSIQDLIGYSLLAGIISGACVSFNGWAMKKRGPVLVSMFGPIGTVISVILSAFLGDSIGLGSLAGMFLMFTGLYFVLWAKGKEGFSMKDEDNSENIIVQSKFLLEEESIEGQFVAFSID